MALLENFPFSFTLHQQSTACGRRQQGASQPFFDVGSSGLGRLRFCFSSALLVLFAFFFFFLGWGRVVDSDMADTQQRGRIDVRCSQGDYCCSS